MMYSQQPGIGPYSVPNKSSMHLPTLRGIVLAASRFLKFIISVRTTVNVLSSSFPQVNYVTCTSILV